MGTMMTFATWGWHAGPWFLLFPLVWIGVLAAVAFLVWGDRTRTDVRSAEAILAERYAKGEISDDEYRQRLGVLRHKAR